VSRGLKQQPRAEPNGVSMNGDTEYEEEEPSENEQPGGWWDSEDPEAPWMTQSTRLMPNTTIALWQFTP